MLQSWKGFLASEDLVSLSMGKEPEMGFQQAPPPGLGETLEPSQPHDVSAVVGLSTEVGCWAASRKRWMVSERHSPLHFQGCSVVCSSFPMPVCEQDVFHSRICGFRRSCDATSERLRLVCSRFRIVLGEKSCHKFGGTGVAFSWEVKTPKC